MDLRDLRAEARKKVYQHKHEPYFGSRIMETVIHIKGVLFNNGQYREYDPSHCEDCRQLILTSSRSIRPDC